MAIHSVEVINLRFEYPGNGFLCAEGRTNARLTSLVRVTLDDGLVGLGSAYSHPDLLRVIVEQHLAPFLIGTDPADTERRWQRDVRADAMVRAQGGGDVGHRRRRHRAVGHPC